MFGPPRAVRRIAIIGNHTPRRCGIATFTKDTAACLRKAGLTVDVFAMSDKPEYEYPKGVAGEIPQDDLNAYLETARQLNMGGYDLVCVQHEFGIFGGPAGCYLLTLLRELKMPIVTTLHTVLQEPNEDQCRVMDELAGLSQRLVVMSKKGRDLLKSVHGIADSKITLIPHGIPDLPTASADKLKEELGLSGKVVLTFGLLSPDKGIEFGIEAMAKVPDATYVILGKTHPHIVRDSGEAYRDRLRQLAEDHGIADRVKFFDRFVDDRELVKFLKMADLYVTPYLKEEQIVSGTLAYTVGNGKAVVSTPYWHAEELLADGRGVLVPFRDAETLGAVVAGLLADNGGRKEIERKAFEYGRQMTWPRIAEGLVHCFEQAAAENANLISRIVRERPAEKESSEMPSERLNHLEVLTDDTGIIQHATFNIPNRDEGYCLDDNARALMLTVKLEAGGFQDRRLYRLQNTFLSFCAHALDKSTGKFRNFLSYDRRWLEQQGSEDSHARALWGLSETAIGASSYGARMLARQLFESAAPAVHEFTSPRAWAYSLLGFVKMGDTRSASLLTGRLLKLYHSTASEDWAWFEDTATYANARLSQSLIVSGAALHNKEALEVGIESLTWLCQIQTEHGRYSPIGNDGFFTRGGVKARFAQQPVEAAGHVSACLSALEATGDPQWRREAQRAFGWFLGRNILGAPMVEMETGGCRDGLHETGPNENQGAESTLSYLTALAELTMRPVLARGARV